MGVDAIPNTVDIAVSGLRAQSTCMNVYANNIANSNTSMTPSGGPYRRQEVVLSTDGEALSGVTVGPVVSDLLTDFKQVLRPGDPRADQNGYVLMPNVDLPSEMINLVTASRAYQANAAVLKRYQEMMDVTIELLR